MKITDITTTALFYPHTQPIQDATVPSHGIGTSGRGELFVHIHTDEGVEGLGIGQSSPGVRQVVEDGLIGLLVGKDPFDIERLWNDMFWQVRGYGRKGTAFCAISAVDIGLWDLKAKALGLPRYKLLGAYTDSVPIYGSGGWTNFDQDGLVAEMTGYVSQGIPRVKMKVGKDFGKSEREDIQRLAAVRKAVGDDFPLTVKLGMRDFVPGGLTLEEGLETAARLEALGVARLADGAARHLSAGERRRTALARALAIQPALLLLDEPLAEIDDDGTDRIRQVLRQCDRTTVIITSPTPIADGFVDTIHTLNAH